MTVVQSENLSEYEENLESIADQILDYAICLLDATGHIQSWNAGAQRLYGYSQQEVVGRHFSVCYTPEDVASDQPRRALERAVQKGTCRLEGLRRRKDQTSFWAAATITAVKDNAGNLRGFTKLTHDISRHKTNEAKYLALFENSHDAVLLTRPADGTILKVNSAACRLFGYPEQELLEKHRDELLDETDPRFAEAWAERAGTGATAAEMTCIRRGGERFEVRVASKLFMDERSQQLSCSTIQDITKQKQVEEALRTSEEKYRTLFTNMTEGFMLAELVLDSAGHPVDARYLELNEAFHAQTGIPRGIEGRRMREFLPQIEQFWIDRLAAVVRTGQPDRIDEYDADTQRHYDVYAFRPSPGRFAILFRDTTEQKRAEDELRTFKFFSYHSSESHLIADSEGRIHYANPRTCNSLGYSEEEIRRLRIHDIAPNATEARTMEIIERTKDGNMMPFESVHRRKDGSTFPVEVSVTALEVKGERLIFSVCRDITERKQAEAALRQSEEKFRATFEHAPLGIAECTVDGRVIEANSKLLEMLGYTKDEIVQLTVIELTHPGDLEESLANLQKLSRGEADTCVMEKRFIRKDRSMVWVNVTGSLAPIHGKPQYMILTVEDISARKKVEADLKQAMVASYHQANHDMLTGLANRAAFHDRLEEALAYAKRDEHLLALHLLDLDQFKSINDTLGHHIGDLLLQEVANRIKSHVRTTDVVARLGGDEFVVIQSHLVEPDGAGILARKLVEEIRRTYVLDGEEVHSGASIGIAVFPTDATNPQALIKYADLALYEAKHRGRFNYQFYRQELGAAFLEAQRMEKELVRALRHDEFCLHYQPQFDLKNVEHIVGIEALLRWRHPTKGTLPAAAFIQDAEHARLMLPIGEWVLQTACRQHKEWIDAGLSVPLTLNLSASQLRDPRLLETIKRILEETGLPGSMLQLEMREHVLWDRKVSNNLLDQMKESGLRLALDDFGAEMMALSSLHKFPLNAVKPGQKLVKSLPSHPREAALLAAIIGVAHDVRIAVCADGVETDDEFAAVKEQGCDSVQGYLLSSPLEASQMKQRIDAGLLH